MYCETLQVMEKSKENESLKFYTREKGERKDGGESGVVVSLAEIRLLLA